MISRSIRQRGAINARKHLSNILTGALLFELGPVNASDQIVLSSGTLGLGTLDFNEFAFTTFAGLSEGDTFTLFQANSHTGTLGVTSGFFNDG